MLQSIVY